MSTSLFDPSRQPIAAGAHRLDTAARRLATTAQRLALLPIRFYKNRRLQTTLSGMGDHALADIGLTRSDVLDTTALPVGTEVGAFLAQRVSDRRRRVSR